MQKLNTAIEQALVWMRGDICDCAHNALEDHLVSLLSDKRERACEAFGSNVGDDSGQMEIVQQWVSKAVVMVDVDEAIKKSASLTAEELRAGGWWCADITELCRVQLAVHGVDVPPQSWSNGSCWDCCFLLGPGFVADRGPEKSKSGLRQIHRVGSEFYWGAPQC